MTARTCLGGYVTADASRRQRAAYTVARLGHLSTFLRSGSSDCLLVFLILLPLPSFLLTRRFLALSWLGFRRVSVLWDLFLVFLFPVLLYFTC